MIFYRKYSNIFNLKECFNFRSVKLAEEFRCVLSNHRIS